MYILNGSQATKTRRKRWEGEVGLSAPVYKWIVVYDDGATEEKYGESPYDFADDLVEVPVAIIRNGLAR